MVTKLNLGTMAVLLLAWACMTITEETATLDPRQPATDELARLEDAFATRPDDPTLAEALADDYLRLNRPDMVVSVLAMATPSVLESPAVGYRLARAYERTGRLDDALATARLAKARCARALGLSSASVATPVPRHGCSERTYAALDVHEAALARMQAWGVTDPRSDARAELAYGLAVRAARIVSASAR